jgi:hypothetical protein
LNELYTVLRVVFNREAVGVGHLVGLPEIKEALPVNQEFRVPVDVQ